MQVFVSSWMTPSTDSMRHSSIQISIVSPPCRVQAFWWEGLQLGHELWVQGLGQDFYLFRLKRCLRRDHSPHTALRNYRNNMAGRCLSHVQRVHGVYLSIPTPSPTRSCPSLTHSTRYWPARFENG